ncbi:hypothetical protein BKA62DRAFT_717527 [Auriculariales sp. MPI-PUGE-AT-0066]|nr:hypothetical protein BKA62DRAFT_717527 [Auriculariales sp. MPI-PUGE-AT-0066]
MADIALNCATTTTTTTTTGMTGMPLDQKLLMLREEEILLLGRRFRPVARVSIARPEHDVQRALDDALKRGLPLIIEGWHKLPNWDARAFAIDALSNASGPDKNLFDYAMTGVHKDLHDYLKDHPCPAQWHAGLQSLARDSPVLGSLMPLGGGDLTSYLPERTRPETLMTYIGHPGTRTPLHRDRCASVGQNMMTHASAPNAEALWLICESGDANRVVQHIRPSSDKPAKGRRARPSTPAAPASSAPKDSTDDDPDSGDVAVLEYERHVATLEEMGRAEFPVYIGCQRVGDLVVIPSRATHQVVNRGGLSCKVAWSRMTAESLVGAIEKDLPVYNLLRVPEVYRVRLTLHHAIIGLTQQLTRRRDDAKPASDPPDHPAPRDALRTLLDLYDRVLVEEWTVDEPPPMDLSSSSSSSLSSPDLEMGVRCDACAGDVFQEEETESEEEAEAMEKDGEETMAIDPALESLQASPGPGVGVGGGDVVMKLEPGGDSVPQTHSHTKHPDATERSVSPPKPKNTITTTPSKQVQVQTQKTPQKPTTTKVKTKTKAKTKAKPKTRRRTPWCTNSDGDRVTLCSACVVQGRACACGTFTPHALLPMGALLKAREDALVASGLSAAAIWPAGAPAAGVKSERFLEEKREVEKVVRTLIADGHLPVARAAELVATRRTEVDKAVSCRYNNYHATTWLASHACKRCARRICFSCFSSRAGVHAIELALCLRPPAEKKKTRDPSAPPPPPVASTSFAIPSSSGGPQRSILSPMPMPPPTSSGITAPGPNQPAAADSAASGATKEEGPVSTVPNTVAKFGRLDLSALFGAASNTPHVDNDWVHSLHTGAIPPAGRHAASVRLADQLGSVLRERIHPAPVGTIRGWYDPPDEDEEPIVLPSAANASATTEAGDGEKNGAASGAAAQGSKKRKRAPEAGDKAHTGDKHAEKHADKHGAGGGGSGGAPLTAREREQREKERERDALAVQLTDLPDAERRDYELAVELSGWRSTRRPRIELKGGETVDVVLPARRKSPPRRVGADDRRRRRRAMGMASDSSEDDGDEDDDEGDGDEEREHQEEERERKRQRKTSNAAQLALPKAPTPIPVQPKNGGLSSLLAHLSGAPAPGPRGKTVRTNIPSAPSPVSAGASQRPKSGPSTAAATATASGAKKDRDNSGVKKERLGPTTVTAPKKVTKSTNGRSPAKDWSDDDDMDLDELPRRRDNDDTTLTAPGSSPVHSQSKQVARRHPEQPHSLEDLRVRASDALGWTHLPWCAPCQGGPRVIRGQTGCEAVGGCGGDAGGASSRQFARGW